MCDVPHFCRRDFRMTQALPIRQPLRECVWNERKFWHQTITWSKSSGLPGFAWRPIGATQDVALRYEPKNDVGRTPMTVSRRKFLAATGAALAAPAIARPAFAQAQVTLR